MCYNVFKILFGCENMISTVKDWNPKQASLKDLLSKKDSFNEAISIALELHSFVHSSEVSDIIVKTYLDELMENLDESLYKSMPNVKGWTIAWNLWHITRIEDIASNILISEKGQVFNQEWQKRMNVSVTDTGNAMTKDEIAAFSSSIDMKVFQQYRDAVGKRTRQVIKELELQELKRKVSPNSLKRVLDEGGVLEIEESRWLLDFWGRKNVAGLLQMPITRHQIVHINDSMRLRKKYQK